MDARFFSVGEVNDETKNYQFIVTLKDNGKWKEFDKKDEQNTNVNINTGKISFGASSFAGHSTGKSISFGFGENKDTGETGLLSFKFDTKIVKDPIRTYLTKCGWKKQGLFL